MQALRRHAIVRILVCCLLTWAAADLLVPDLCSAEAAGQASGGNGARDADDCFCCCSHTEQAVRLEPMVVVATPSPRLRVPAERLSPGVPRSLYHPPLSL